MWIIIGLIAFLLFAALMDDGCFGCLLDILLATILLIFIIRLIGG